MRARPPVRETVSGRAGDPQTALVEGQPLRYRVRRSRRARRPGVQVCRQQGVVITLPWRTAGAEVPRLLARWGSWLAGKADELGVRLGPVVRGYATGSEILVLGRPRRLEVQALPAGKVRPVVALGPDSLVMQLGPDDVWDPRPVLERHLRGLARADLPGRVDRWAAVVGRRPRKVIIGERTTRWGSCSARGTVSFCYRLVMAPPAAIDAVVAHEVCHLAHLDHGPGFYALLDAACPDHRQAARWLADHHDRLIL